MILRTIATALAEIRRRKLRAEAVGPQAGHAKRVLTTTDMARRWAQLFADPAKPSDFNARLRTLRRLLPAFLDHLRTGAVQHAGKTIRRASEIKAVYKAISQPARNGSGAKAETTTPSAVPQKVPPPVKPSAQPPVPAALVPFEIKLRYSAPAREEECRNRPPGSLPPATLTYMPVPVSASSSERAVRKDRQGKIEFVPELPIRKNFMVRSLIDRLVILVSIRKSITGPTLKTSLKSEAKVTSYAQDRTTVGPKETDWRKRLPDLNMSKHTGYHFAIMIQDPWPEKLVAALEVIDDNFGIEGSVELFLVELSIDFYPKRDRSSDEQILMREQMAGLLQRHHWASMKLLQGRQPQRPRDADARQVYKIEGGMPDETKNRYLFPDPTNRQYADIEFHRPEVAARVLRSTRGDVPFLNATLLKGCDETGRKVSIQNKVADQRNPTSQTPPIMAEEERRARIEITLIGQDILREHGLAGVETLAAVPFRALRKKLLQFRLPLVEPEQHRLNEAIAHMQRRGVYGIELAAKVRALQDTKARRAAGGPKTRERRGEGDVLRDWEEVNTLAGEALDELDRKWRSFRWK